MAGGQSRRMGKDKAFIEYDGVTMIERVINAVAPCVESVVIIANKPELYEKFGLPVYPDTIVGMGPLSGLYTAFDKTGADEILMAACDMPQINREIVQFIVDNPAGAEDAVIPLVGGKEQGLLAVYRRSAIEKHIDRIKAVSIQFDEFRHGLDKLLIDERQLRKIEPELQSFRNINSPTDL